MIHYVHNRKYKDDVDGTVAIVPFTKKDLENIFQTHSNQSMTYVGVALTSKHDNFVKSIGRSVAEQKLKQTVVNFNFVEQQGTTHVYYFKTNPLRICNQDYEIYFELTTVKESEHVKLIDAQIRKCS